MAFTLSTYGNYVAGTTGIGNGDHYTVSTASAETVTLPVDTPLGYKFTLSQNGANAITIAAGSGETLVGDTTTAADNDVLYVFRSGETEWTGANLTILA